MTISLCTFVKNEAHCLEHMLAPLKDYVQEIIVVDTGSTDDTLTVARRLATRIYQIGFSNFGAIRTLTAHLAREPWVLMLDADETLSHPERLASLIASEKSEAYAFSRKRWLDLAMTQQTELEAYPDYQVRLFKNNPNYQFKRELHEFFDGTAVVNTSELEINHFHDVFKSDEALKSRRELYEKLAAQAKVTIEGGHEVP